jgi:hypothetical protein
MRRILMIAVTALAAALLLVPAAVQARGSHHKRASAADRNHDGIPDSWEKRNHLSLKVNQAKRDQDRDGLNNRGEFRAGTNPRDADTDNDGVNDGSEETVGMNPKSHDSDHDGRPDSQENAGTVKSFDGTTLTITLAAGGEVSGKVVDGVTEIKCRPAAPTTTTTSAKASHNDGSGDSPGDSGKDEGNANNNDDNGDNDNDGNDDHGQSNCSAADLQPNTVVHEADLNVTSSGAVFDEIKLVK